MDPPSYRGPAVRTNTTDAAARLQVLRHDFGTLLVEPNFTLTHTFILENPGDGDGYTATIENPKPCCIGFRLNNTNIVPSEPLKAELALKVGKSQGLTHGYATVRPARPGQKSYRFEATAHLLPPLSMEPLTHDIGQLYPGDNKEWTVQVVSHVAVGTPWSPPQISTTSTNDLTATAGAVVTEIVPDNPSLQRHRFSLEVRLRATESPGYHQQQVRLAWTTPEKNLVHTVNFQVLPWIEVKPKALVIKSTGPTDHTVVLTCRDGNHFRIQDVQAPHGATVHWKKSMEAPRHEIQVQIASFGEKSGARGVVEISTTRGAIAVPIYALGVTNEQARTP